MESYPGSPRTYMPYGDDLRPKRPASQRSPVIKLTPTKAHGEVPGPGSYNPSHVGKPQASAWTMGDRAARKSSVQSSAESPGPMYQMRSGQGEQVSSIMPSSPRHGFGTAQRFLASAGETVSPGPGTYSPRVTYHASPSNIQTVHAGQLTSVTTPRGSVHMTEGTWSRLADRTLVTIKGKSPGSETYSPSVAYTKHAMPAYTMRELGSRAGLGGSAESPGPLAYHPHVKSR